MRSGQAKHKDTVHGHDKYRHGFAACTERHCVRLWTLCCYQSRAVQLTAYGGMNNDPSGASSENCRLNAPFLNVLVR